MLKLSEAVNRTPRYLNVSSGPSCGTSSTRYCWASWSQTRICSGRGLVPFGVLSHMCTVFVVFICRPCDARNLAIVSKRSCAASRVLANSIVSSTYAWAPIFVFPSLYVWWFSWRSHSHITASSQSTNLSGERLSPWRTPLSIG